MPRPPENQQRELLEGAETPRSVELKEGPMPELVASAAARHRLGSGVLTLLAVIAATYLVPGLEIFQPWRAEEDYLPF